MLLHIELWKPRERWLALTKEERATFIGNHLPSFRSMMHAGIEVVGWGVNDDDTPHRADFTYFTVWRVPSRDALCLIEDAVEASGWHDYFEQVNARGEMQLPKAIVEQLIQGNAPGKNVPRPNERPAIAAVERDRPGCAAGVRVAPPE